MTSSARVRPGHLSPGGLSTWEVITGEGEHVSILALRFSESEANAFRDGFNLGRIAGMTTKPAADEPA